MSERMSFDTALRPIEWDSTRRQLSVVRDLIEPINELKESVPAEVFDEVSLKVGKDLQRHRDERDQELHSDELMGTRDTDEIRALRAGLKAVDARIDERWTTWFEGARKGSLPFSWSAPLDALNTAASSTRRWEARRNLSLLVLVGVGLIALVAAATWSFIDGSAAAYFATFAAAAATAFITYYGLQRQVSRPRLWVAVLAPLVTLTCAMALLATVGDGLEDGEDVALAAAGLLLLAGLVLAAVEVGRRQSPARQVVVRSVVELPERTEDAAYAQKLGDYLEELRVTVLRESNAREINARKWRRIFVALGVSAAILSAGAGVTGLSVEVAEVAAVLALFGGGLSAAVTLLNPAAQAQQDATVGLSCSSLAEEINVLIRIDLPRDLGHSDRLDHLRQQVETISVRFDELRGVPQRPRLWPERIKE